MTGCPFWQLKPNSKGNLASFKCTHGHSLFKKSREITCIILSCCVEIMAKARGKTYEPAAILFTSILCPVVEIDGNLYILGKKLDVERKGYSLKEYLLCVFWLNSICLIALATNIA